MERREAEDWCGNSYGWIRILKVKVLSLSNAAQVGLQETDEEAQVGTK